MKRLIVAIWILLGLQSCSEVRKIGEMNRDRLAPSLVPADDIRPQELGLEADNVDTAELVDVFGTEMYLMPEGETIAPSIKVASSRNVAERHGKVDIKFKICIPPSFLHDRFQLRIFPMLSVEDDSTALDGVFITGSAYRRFQQRGYQRYERFLKSIVTDTTLFIRKHDLEVFLERNIPQIYALKSDSTYVTEEEFESLYGVNEQEAVVHYTDKFLKNANLRRIAGKEQRFKRYVKSPIIDSGIRLDTIVHKIDGTVEYEYVQTLNVGSQVRKAIVSLEGNVHDPERMVYEIPSTEPLTFYISSLSTLVDTLPRYRLKVIERHVHDNMTYRLRFGVGSADLRSDLYDNAGQLAMIEDKIFELVSGSFYDVDSIMVTASASPEGSFGMNASLSGRRGEAICSYFRKLWPLRYRILSENWDLLSELVSEDGYLSGAEKDDFFHLMESGYDADGRERKLTGKPYYRYLLEELYPQLRLVRMDFYLQRKDMVKDTIHTMELDTVYMEAVRLVRDRNYKAALPVLKEAADFNAALCFASLDYNKSALEILESLGESARTLYLKAVVLSRLGDEKAAVECYKKACEKDRTYIHRGNLDPEISGLINKYKIKTDQL